MIAATTNINAQVLILILLEVTQINSRKFTKVIKCLNPYSTGSNSNGFTMSTNFGFIGLNPYSTGSNSNHCAKCGKDEFHLVLILILLEVTQIGLLPRFQISFHGVLILILLEVTQMFE